MKISQTYSHLNGEEFLLVHKPVLWEEVRNIIENVNEGKAFGKISKEETKAGEAFYSSEKLNKLLKNEFFVSGWNEMGTAYFVKDSIAVEVWLGKYFSVQYDLHVKHTFFYERGDIDVGIEIIPMHSLMSQMSTGVAWYENELTNIVREGRSNPSVPVVLIGIEAD